MPTSVLGACKPTQDPEKPEHIVLMFECQKLYTDS